MKGGPKSTVERDFVVAGEEGPRAVKIDSSRFCPLDDRVPPSHKVTGSN